MTGTGYYRQCIPDYDRIAEPLVALTRKHEQNSRGLVVPDSPRVYFFKKVYFLIYLYVIYYRKAVGKARDSTYYI